MSLNLAPQSLEETVEHGSVTFLFRPRVGTQPDELGDVQRLLILLGPENHPYERLIAIGRKRLPRSAKRDRFWGFVDLVLGSSDMAASLEAQVSTAWTRGLRHIPAAQPFAYGTYSLTTDGQQSHLRWHVDRVEPRNPIAFDVDVEPDADYLVTIANPDLAAWGLAEAPDLPQTLFDELELHVPIPNPFPPPLQSRFGTRRFLHLDSSTWLDHPGTEIVFAGHPS